MLNSLILKKNAIGLSDLLGSQGSQKSSPKNLRDKSEITMFKGGDNIFPQRTLGDVFPNLFWSKLTDKDREAVANLSRFRNMGVSPEGLANADYEAKMSLAFAEYYRVLRDDGVMTVQFNHKDSGAWNVLAKSLIDAGFEANDIAGIELTCI